MLRVAAAESFRTRAKTGVTTQAHREDLAIKLAPLEKPGEQGVEDEIQAAFVKLHRMHANAMRPMFLREMPRPGQIGRSAVTTPRHKTAHAPKRMSQRNARRHHVR